MPRFYFDTTDVLDVVDEEGSELPDLDAARRLAFAALGDMLKDIGRHGRSVRCRIVVRDEADTQLFAITGNMVEEAA